MENLYLDMENREGIMSKSTIVSLLYSFTVGCFGRLLEKVFPDKLTKKKEWPHGPLTKPFFKGRIPI